MWIILFAIVLALTLGSGLVRAAVLRHRKRQQRSMKNHLNRISHTYE